MNPAKVLLRKTRDTFLARITRQLKDLDGKVGNHLSLLEDAQARLKADQVDIYNDLLDKIQNSGTLVLSEKEMISKIFSGTKIVLDPRDLVVAPHLALDHIWEYPTTMAWLSVVCRHDTVIDIGANFGYFGLIATQIMEKKRSKVVFFEANPHLIPYINKTLTMDWLHEQCDIENIGIADKEGYATLTLLKDYIGSSSLHTPEHLDAFMHGKMVIEPVETIKIPTTTLDSYCDQHHIKTVDLIKMDIEGYEEKAYKGMRKTIERSPNVTLFVEFTQGSYDNPKVFYEQMLHDFGHVYLIGPTGQLIKQKNVRYEAVIGRPDDWVMPVFSKRANLGIIKVA